MKRIANISSAALLCLINFLFIANSDIAAQSNKSTISGSVKDSSGNKPITYATIELYKGNAFTTPVRSTYTNSNGVFELTKIDTGSYTLIISSSNYSEKLIPVSVGIPGNKQNLGNIFLAFLPKYLQGITVTARKPLVEQTDDKITYNAENDPVAGAENATDILRKTPLVSVDGDGNITLNGQDNFKVLLNGRETSMFARNIKEALKGFPGALIKKIEVITNPSAKYDAEGIGGLINIITKKKVAGYNGTVGTTYNTQGFVGANASLNYKIGKLGISATFNSWNNIKLKNKTDETIESLHPVSFTKRVTSGNGVNTSWGQFGNIEMSYDVDSLNTLAAYYNIGGGNFKSKNTSVQNIYSTSSSLPVENIYTSYDKNQSPNFTTGIDFIHKYKSNPEKEFSLKLNGNYGKDHRYSTSILDNTSFDRFAINETNANNKEYTIQADYIHPLKKKSKLESGAKAILRQANSSYQSLMKYNEVDDYKINPLNSDDFSYHQNVYSVYGTYSFPVKKYNFRLGARIERTNIKGDFENSDAAIRQTYTNIVPNILLSTKLKNGHNISLGYSMRLQRPFISNLNPFVNNSDSLFVSRGNPSLDAQTFHSITFQYRLSKGKTFINLSLSNSFSNNRIIQFAEFNNVTGITITYPANIGKSMQFGLTGNVNTSFSSKWTFNSNIRLAYDDIKNVTFVTQGRKGISGNINFNSTFKITSKFGTNAYIGLNRGAVTIQGKQSAGMWYGCGFTHKFFKDKLNIILNATNFHTKLFGIKLNSEDAAFRRFYHFQFPFRGAGINLTWSFGKLKDSNVSKKRGVTNDDLIGK